MRTTVIALMLSAIGLAQDVPPVTRIVDTDAVELAAKANAFFGTNKFYWSGIGILASGSAFDAWSSYKDNQKVIGGGHLHETNPFLANANGTFNLQRGIGTKAIVLVTAVGFQRFIIWTLEKKYGRDNAGLKKVERAFAWTNIGFGAISFGVGARNLSLR